MNTNGKLFNRIAKIMTMVLLALVISLPLNGSVLAAAFVPDDFNRCSLDTSLWQFQNPAGLSSRISGQYTGDSGFEMVLPQGTVATFSNTRNAPRIMQPATDADFEVEVKFTSPLGPQTGNNYHMQGILIHDAAANKWLRFDLDTGYNASVGAPAINAYVAYLEAAPTYYGLFGPGRINSSVNATPTYLRVKYEKTANRWSFGYRLGETGNITWRYSFVETDALPGLPNGITFNVSHIGVFAGATGSNTPGFTSRVDYIRSVPDTFTDDANTISVTRVGNGTVNWPMTNPAQQCSGNQVTLTASPAGGASFSGWSGDIVNPAPTIQLMMNRSYNLTATFGGAPLDLPFDLFMPLINN